MFNLFVAISSVTDSLNLESPSRWRLEHIQGSFIIYIFDTLFVLSQSHARDFILSHPHNMAIGASLTSCGSI